MPAGNRYLVSAILLLVLLGGLNQFRSDWLAALRQEWKKIPDTYREFEESQRMQQKLREQESAVLRRVKTMEHLTCEFLDGKISLTHTAAWFKRLQEQEDGQPTHDIPFPGATPEEKYCRQVASWVESYVQFDPNNRNSARIKEMRQELAVIVAQPQGVHLPRL
jgi:hypothetical protein